MMLKTLLSTVFVGNENWAWRRRVAVSSAATMIACILHSTFWDPDLAHATMVMGNCITGLSLVLTIYVGGAVADDQLARRADNKAAQIAQGNPT